MTTPQIPATPKGPTHQKQTLRQRIDDIILREMGVDEEVLRPAARFLEDLQADSLDTAELEIAIEEAFDLPEESIDFERIRTVGQLYEHVERATKG